MVLSSAQLRSVPGGNLLQPDAFGMLLCIARSRVVQVSGRLKGHRHTNRLLCLLVEVAYDDYVSFGVKALAGHSDDSPDPMQRLVPVICAGADVTRKTTFLECNKPFSTSCDGGNSRISCSKRGVPMARASPRQRKE